MLSHPLAAGKMSLYVPEDAYTEFPTVTLSPRQILKDWLCKMLFKTVRLVVIVLSHPLAAVRIFV